MRKGAGESWEALPGLSRTTPLAVLREEGWYPKAAKGERSSSNIAGLMKLTFFHRESGMPSGPRAEEGADLERASLISSPVRGVDEGSLFRRSLLGRGSLGGKKWPRSALLIATGLETSRREGNLGVFLGATSCLAVHMLFGEVFARKSAP